MDACLTIGIPVGASSRLRLGKGLFAHTAAPTASGYDVALNCGRGDLGDDGIEDEGDFEYRGEESRSHPMAICCWSPPPSEPDPDDDKLRKELCFFLRDTPPCLDVSSGLGLSPTFRM